MAFHTKQKALLSMALGAWLAVAAGRAEGQAGVPAPSAPGPPAASAVEKQLGSIRAIDGSRLWLLTDQGGQVAVQVQPGAHLLRLAPGQTDLRNATAIQLSDLQAGDRVLVRGKLQADGKSLDAASVLVMKQQDIAQRKREEMLDWQLRGIAGLVRQVDLQAGTTTVSDAASGRTVMVRVTPKTTYKRYAPDSVKWEDAVASRLSEIHGGDQLRAKGNRSQDGAQLEAEEMVFGSFRNIAGLVTAIDAAQLTVTVGDLATKKPVTVRITADSQMRKLSPEAAARLAVLLKGRAPQAETNAGPPAETTAAGPAGRGIMRTRSADLNLMLARLPAAGLGDLQKGEAVMIVSTMGSGDRLPEAVTLLGGVEPILTANPGDKGSDSLLTPWSLASAPGGEQP